MRERIFLSYSHGDEDWHDKFKAVLGHGVYAQRFDLWSDKSLDASTDWHRAIHEAIAGSRIALLLVSRKFLGSDFIISKEYEYLLRRRELGAMSIRWVPLEAISVSEMKLAKLDAIHAAWPLKKPFVKLGKKIDDAIYQISEKLADEFVLNTKTDEVTRTELFQAVSQAVGLNSSLGEVLALGDFSIIYRAKRLDSDVAVKALIPSPRRPWLKEQFVVRANTVRNVNNEAAIVIRDVIARPEVQCVTMELVSAPTLKARMQKTGPLPYDEVVDILAQLSRVADDLHKLAGSPLVGPIRPSHVHYDEKKKARISLLHIANETMPVGNRPATALLDDDGLTYLSPERYSGASIDPRVDQYYLGLLALELLQGKPPVCVTKFSDLENKAHFFEAPRSYFGDLRSKHPAFSFVLARMLERAPEKRWPSMSTLTDALEQLSNGGIPDAVRAQASDDYCEKLGKDDAFIAVFYELLLDFSEAVRQLFEKRKVTVSNQSRKLNNAMVDIFNFHRHMKPSTLDRHIQPHCEMGLDIGHFNAFREAFLGALRKSPRMDDYSEDAWRALLDPALAYMQEKICSDAVVIDG